MSARLRIQLGARVGALVGFWVLLPAACLWVVVQGYLPQKAVDPDQIAFVVTLAKPQGGSDLTIDASYYADTATDIQTVRVDFANTDLQAAIRSAQVWFRPGTQHGFTWKCGFDRSRYEENGIRSTPPVTPKPLLSYPRVGQKATREIRPLLQDQTWHYPLAYGVTMNAQSSPPDPGDVSVATAVVCTRALPSTLTKELFPALAAPAADVVVMNQSRALFSSSYDVRYPVNWTINSIERDTNFGGGELKGPSMNPGEIRQSRSPLDMSGGEPFSTSLPGPNIRFTNPDAQHQSDLWGQFALLVLGAWLGVVGGAVGSRLLPTKTVDSA